MSPDLRQKNSEFNTLRNKQDMAYRPNSWWSNDPWERNEGWWNNGYWGSGYYRPRPPTMPRKIYQPPRWERSNGFDIHVERVRLERLEETLKRRSHEQAKRLVETAKLIIADILGFPRWEQAKNFLKQARSDRRDGSRSNNMGYDHGTNRRGGWRHLRGAEDSGL